jgi:hypothetical protein
MVLRSHDGSPPREMGVMKRSNRSTRKFRAARFTSKRDRKQSIKEVTSNTYFDRPPALASFHRGQVLHARVFFDDEPGIHKVRPVVFLREVDRRVAEVLPVYSSIHEAKRAQSVQVTIVQRDCYLSLEPIHVDRAHITTSTRETFDLSQLQDEGGEK